MNVRRPFCCWCVKLSLHIIIPFRKCYRVADIIATRIAMRYIVLRLLRISLEYSQSRCDARCDNNWDHTSIAVPLPYTYVCVVVSRWMRTADKNQMPDIDGRCCAGPEEVKLPKPNRRAKIELKIGQLNTVSYFIHFLHRYAYAQQRLNNNRESLCNLLEFISASGYWLLVWHSATVLSNSAGGTFSMRVKKNW